MNTKQVVALFLLLIGGIFFYIQAHKLLSNSSTSSASSAAPWITYENTAYNYTLSYPSGSRVVKISEEEPVTDAESLAVEVTGGRSPVVVKVQPLQTHLPIYAHASEEYLKFISLDLKSFVEYGRNSEIAYLTDHKSTYNANLRPSSIQNTLIGGQQAYGFSINGYSEVWPLGGFEGPALSGTNNYYVIQNSKDDKFIIAYPANDPVAQKIVDSFRFINASNTTPIEN